MGVLEKEEVQRPPTKRTKTNLGLVGTGVNQEAVKCTWLHGASHTHGSAAGSPCANFNLPPPKQQSEFSLRLLQDCGGLRFNVMRTEFYQLFCYRPWYVIAVITATIVTVGTCIQAYTSVIGSDKMQPHFPP